MKAGGLRASLIGAIVAALGALVLTLMLLEEPLVQYRIGQLAQETLDDALREAAGELGSATNPTEADPIADTIGAERGVRLTILGPDGHIIGDSGFDGAFLNLAAPWVHEAALEAFHESDRRYSLDRDAHVALMQLESDVILQATIATATGERVRAAVRELLIIGSAMAVLVAIFLTVVLSRTLIEPAQKLTEVADALATGDLSARTQSDRDDELGAIGRALDRMADQLKDRIDNLRSEQDRLRTILNSMVEAVFVTDSLGRIQQTNAALDALVEGEARGRTANEAIRSPELHEAVRAARKGDACDVDLELERHGKRLFFSAQVAPLSDQAGVVVVLHNVTRAREADRIRRDFVANASHELRTPLTAIRGFAETLRDGAGENPEQRNRFLDVILRHTMRLNALVSDLAALSKAESPEHQVDLEEINAHAVAVEVIRGLGSKADQRKVSLAFEPSEDSPRVRANGRSLDQVMVNLVDNAIKYTPEGSEVTVSTRVEGDRFLIAVHNPGPGIDAKHIPRLFERFYRIDPGRARDVGGTGLGLAIVKHLCSEMGADVGVRSEKGHGATFEVRLPRSLQGEPEGRKRSRPEPEKTAP